MSTSEELRTFLESRRSVRDFQSTSIPIGTIERILQTATYAPSAHNKQPWRFAVVLQPDTRHALGEAFCQALQEDMINDGLPEVDIQARLARTRKRIANAPVVVIVCREAGAVKSQPDKTRMDAEIRMGRQSVAMAGLQCMLAAHLEGLGSTWICWPLFAPKAVTGTLDLPESWEPEGMLFLGEPAET
ncbi:nitroreductase family protein, partial [bacterium]|nr:nitroreductase family protein [bacterium]